MFTRKRAGLAAAVLALAGVLTLALPATSAYASNAGDPVTTGCSNTGITGKYITVYADGYDVGNLALRYSTACQTEWVTFYAYSGFAANNFYFEPSVWMQNQSGTNLYTAPSSSYMGWTVYTDMLSNMKYQTACGGMQLYWGAYASGEEQLGYIGWYYIGCW